MTPQTTTQRTAAHRRRMAEKMARMTAGLTEIAECHPAWIENNPEWAIEKAQKALQGSETTQKPLDPTQRG